MIDRSLTEVLNSVSDVLFPSELGSAPVILTSVGVGSDTPLHVLTSRGDANGVAILLRAHAAVDAVGEMGHTPLHLAVSQENEQLIRLLLSAGANPDIRSEWGITARELAANKGSGMAALFE